MTSSPYLRSKALLDNMDLQQLMAGGDLKQEEAARRAGQDEETQEEGGGLDELRDMSGDAVTLVEAWAQGGRDESSLAAVRNLRRRPDYTRERLAEHCYVADFPGDIRCPDWPVLMGPLLVMGEVVKKLDVARVRWEELLDVRVGVIVTNEHAVAVFNIGEEVFRMYDNCLLYTSPSPRDQRGYRRPSCS